MHQGASRVDILLVADFRRGDAAASASVALVEALASAGYIVAVLPWRGAAAAEPDLPAAGFTDLLRRPGVRRVSFDGALHARLTLAVDLRLFRHAAARRLAATADRRLCIVTRRFATFPREARDVLDRAEEALGGSLRLAPSAPPLRAQLQALLPDLALEPEDWPPVAVADPRRSDRPLRRVSRVGLGYFRASFVRPWPATPEALRRILPPRAFLAFEVMDPPESLVPGLAAGPAAARFWPRAAPLRDFLRAADLLVCGDAADDDPYPEEALAGLAQGTIPLLSGAYRGHFFAAAAHFAGEVAAESLAELYASPGVVADLRDAGAELLERHLSPDRAAERVARLIGPPGKTLASAALARPRGCVLSLSTNGIGMGHLTRQLAIVTRLEAHLQPAFIGLSQAVNIVRAFGFPSEYIPHYGSVGLDYGYWDETLAVALESAVRFYRPRALAYDGNNVFGALERLRHGFPELPMIWVRRPFWDEAFGSAALGASGIFDLVIEPGEIAQLYDTGPTTALREQVRVVNPIRLLDPEQMLTREEAARGLGIEADTLNVLVLPGAQNNVEAGSFWAEVVAELAGWEATRVVVGEWAISARGSAWPEHVIRARGFPYARWFRAFDFAISAAGYNSFAETTAAGLPAVFVPNDAPHMDRQDLRARFAEHNGLGLALSTADRHRIRPVLRSMRDSARRASFRAALLARATPNGAVEAAALVTDWAETGIAHRRRAWERVSISPERKAPSA